jgi:hypothetical protein
MKITKLPNGCELYEDNGDKYYFLNDKRHREDGPAVEYNNGDKYWCIDGKYHRADGPAIEYAHGDKYWYLNGQYIHCTNQKEFERLMRLRAFW